jgi:hypothetical protein
MPSPMPSSTPPRLPVTRRQLLAWPLVTVAGEFGLGLGLAATALPAWASAPAIELLTLRLRRADGALSLDFAARIHLSRAVEEALQRGVPVYFTAQAQLLRNRWYWRDERVARVQRTWRLAFQPLTSSWRVGFGGLNQTQATLEEALASLSRLSDWKIADLAQVDPDSRHYVEFSFRLDTSQLPGPMQFGLTTQADWTLGVERTLRLE